MKFVFDGGDVHESFASADVGLVFEDALAELVPLVDEVEFGPWQRVFACAEQGGGVGVVSGESFLFSVGAEDFGKDLVGGRHDEIEGDVVCGFGEWAGPCVLIRGAGTGMNLEQARPFGMQAVAGSFVLDWVH